jgi:putative hydrolase of the HAD superfamily
MPPVLAQSLGQETASRVDAVLFDYGQVLSKPPQPAAWAHMLALTGAEDASLHAAYWEFRHDYDRAALTGAAYWHAVAERAGFALDDATLAALCAADVDLWTGLNLPMVEWAARLQKAGIRTGILSNIGDDIAAGIVARCSWLAGFYHCTWSHALFMAKPEPEIFLKTAEAIHTEPSRILFLDDREDNIAAAAALGFQTIRYTTHPDFEREMRERGYAWLLEAGIRQ